MYMCLFYINWTVTLFYMQKLCSRLGRHSRVRRRDRVFSQVPGVDGSPLWEIDHTTVNRSPFQSVWTDRVKLSFCHPLCSGSTVLLLQPEFGSESTSWAVIGEAMSEVAWPEIVLCNTTLLSIHTLVGSEVLTDPVIPTPSPGRPVANN